MKTMFDTLNEKCTRMNSILVSFLRQSAYSLRKSARSATRNDGQLLLEMLVAISIAAVILGLGGTLIYANLSGTKTVSEIDQANRLVEETFEIVRAVAYEKWKGPLPDPLLGGTKGLYDFDKGSNNLHYIKKGADIEDSVEKPYRWIDHTDGVGGTRWTTKNIKGVAGTPNGIWIAGDDSHVWVWDGEGWTQF